MRAWRTLAAAATIAVAPACGKQESQSAPQQHAPPQGVARLAAIREHYEGGPRSVRELVTLGADRSQVDVVLAGSGPRPVSPSWSPDARRILFTGLGAEIDGADYHYNRSDLFAVRADGTKLERLTSTGDASIAVPSPDGRFVAFARAEHQGAFPITVGLWLKALDGGEERRVLDGQDGQIDYPGSWSPDSRLIAFTRCHFREPERNGMQPNTCGIYVVTPDGSGLRELAERSSMPAYSPDGEQIAFVTDRDENDVIRTGEDEQAFANDLYVMRADGGDQRRLADTPEIDEEGPSWSPDGSRIAYTQEGPASFAHQLMVIATDGRCPTRIAGDAARNDARRVEVGQAAWRPGRLLTSLPRLPCD